MTPYEVLLGALHLAVGVVNLLLGLVIFREAPRQRLHQIACILLFSAGLGALLGSSGFLVLLLRSTDSPVLPVDFVRSFAYLWEFFFPALLLLSALYPQESGLIRRHRSLEIWIFVPHAFHFFIVLGISSLGPDLGFQRLVESAGILRPFASILQLFLTLLLKSHQRLFSFVNLTYIALSLWLIITNLRATSNPTIRRQLQTIFTGLGTCTILYSIVYPIPDLLGRTWPVLLSSSVLVAALAVGTGSIGYAIVRFKFLDLHHLVRRSILYATVTALMVGLYLAIVRYLGHMALRTAGLDAEILDPVFLVLALLLFQPLLQRVETFLETVLLTTPTDHRQILAQASRDMSASTTPQAVGRGLVSLLTEGLGLRGGGFLRSTGGALRVEAVDNVDPRALEVLTGKLPLGAGEWPEGRPMSGPEISPWLPPGVEAPALVVPVLGGDRLLGALVLGAKATRTRFNREEWTLLQTLTGYLALTLENLDLLEEKVERARLEDQLSLARRIQQSILPASFPEDHGLDMWGVQMPSLQVGGDYYDVIRLGPGRYAVAIADVSGKGVPAALLMSMVAAGLRTLHQSDVEVSKVLSSLNRLLCRATAPEQFVTFFLAHVDVREMKLAYANAGHSFPILISRDGHRRFLSESGMLLGVLPSADYREEEVGLAGESGLLLYTDGVTEAESPDGEMFGEERLLSHLDQALESPRARDVVESIQQRVLGFSGEGSLSDDLTLLLVRLADPSVGGASPGGAGGRVDGAGPAQSS